jgi:hypothetical protein
MMATDGCMVTAITNALNAYGYKVDPGQVCDRLNADNGFNSEGLVIWQAIERNYPNTTFIDTLSVWTTNYDQFTSKVQIGEALRLLRNIVSLGMPVFLNVDNIGNDKRPDHFITLYHAPETGPWKAKDPDGGYDVLLEAGYKYGPKETAIYGFRVLMGNTITFPDYVPASDHWQGLAAWKASQVYAGKNVKVYSKELLDAFAQKV